MANSQESFTIFIIFSTPLKTIKTIKTLKKANGQWLMANS